MKKIMLALLCVLLLSAPVYAEIQTYSDDYISFQYDDEMEGAIGYVSFNSLYSFSLSGKYKNSGASINIHCDADYIENFHKESESDKSRIVPCADNEFERDIFFIESGAVSHQKMIVLNDEYSIILSLTTLDGASEDNLCSKEFIDSFEYNADAIINNLIFSDDYHVIYIFKNYKYPKQAVTYAKKALETCKKYMNMELSGEEAADIFEKLKERAKSYMEYSEFTADSDMYFAISSFYESYFTSGKDGEILKRMETLEQIIEHEDAESE